MPETIVPSQAKRMTIEAVVTRADGRVENLGVVTYWHKNPLKRWAWKVGKISKDIVRRVKWNG